MRIFLPFCLFLSGAALAAPIQKEAVVEDLADPMSLAIAPDGDVYIVSREGSIIRVHPQTGAVFEVAQLTVSALRSTDPKSDSAVEDGLQGIALDPDFAKNNRVFLYYSVPDKLIDRLSRFSLRDGKLDPASELILLDIPVQRHDRICHHGGSVQFGPGGLLYLSVGDNTNPFASDGSSPTDFRENRTPWDAGRSAGNTNDLRGKILRIRPTETGYEIPPGNLFPKGTEKTRPEIYVMGCRNPFRSSIDPKNSTLYWGEVGPDANKDSDRGPSGYDEVNQARTAGNYGWPFVIADNKPYHIFDFAADKPGELIDPAAPKNLSIRNTGLQVLPPARSAFIWYPYADSKEFPVVGSGGRNAMAGPVFYYDARRKFNILSKDDDHTLLTYDWIRGKIWKAKLGAEEKLQKLEVLMEGLNHPMDMEMAPDGSIWLLDYGSEWWFNKNGKLLHLTPDNCNHPPALTIEPTAGKEDSFSVKSATDPDNNPLTVTWWVTEGNSERKLGSGSTASLPDHKGSEIRAVATDGKGGTAIARILLTKEKGAPELKLELPSKPESLASNDHLPFKITAETAPDPSKVLVRARYIPATGHDAGGPQFPEAVKQLFTSKQCFACHQVDQNSVGPAYLNVSLKYRDRTDAADYLKGKLKTGSSKVWGEVPMPPQAAVNDEEANQLISAILMLADGITESRGSVAGELVLNHKPSESGGAWEISAEAPGYTTAKIRIPAK